eukprot:GHVU01170314.1.p3 GENE.GHVU01170314.1~~GHVU01170314.1.p3  ORF type:complete len:141 (+),score=7.47 GHVU01170314.1:144-566(+)
MAIAPSLLGLARPTPSALASPSLPQGKLSGKGVARADTKTLKTELEDLVDLLDGVGRSVGGSSSSTCVGIHGCVVSVCVCMWMCACVYVCAYVCVRIRVYHRMVSICLKFLIFPSHFPVSPVRGATAPPGDGPVLVLSSM